MKSVTIEPHSQPRRVPRAAALAVLGLLLLVPPLALGNSTPGKPRFLPGTVAQEVFSTRVRMELQFDPESLQTTCTAEYGESATGPWTFVNSKVVETASHVDGIWIGEKREEKEQYEGYFLRGLMPGRSYYAHFVCTNADGEAQETVPFTTQPVKQPQIDYQYLGYERGENSSFRESEGKQVTDHTAGFQARIDNEGATVTEYVFEYSQDGVSWKPFTSGATGTITLGEEYRNVEAHLTGLKPETTYYVRVTAINEKGKIIQTTYTIGAPGPGGTEASSFTTGTAKPSGQVEVRNVTAASAFVSAAPVLTHGSQTQSRLEYAESAGGPWSPVPGGMRTISQGEAEAEGWRNSVFVGGVRLTGLKPSTTYYVRLFAENTCLEGCGSFTGKPVSFRTSGASPEATTFMVHRLVGGSLELLGAVNPDSSATSAEQSIMIEGAPTGGTFTLTFNGRTTSAIPYNAPALVVGNALTNVLGGNVGVGGLVGGPYTVYFGYAAPGVTEPLIGCHSEFTPSGSCTVATTQQGGLSSETHYRFLYVSEKAFAEHGWANPSETASVAVAPGESFGNVAAMPPGLTGGETYRFKLVAQSNTPGTGLVEGVEQSLVVPAPPAVPGGEACPNEVFRVGLSARLPDCRAYEQLTPVEKGGTQEPFHYGGGEQAAVLVGEDGEHAVLEAPQTSFGLGSGSGQSPYLFSRTATGWSTIAGAPQPETGINTVHPQVYSADLTHIAFESEYQTSQLGKSPTVSYRVGPVGGPYTTVASVPRSALINEGEHEGWVAGNGDRFVLATSDRTLAGEEPTPTKSGLDLYEYTVAGGLRQLNVTGTGSEAVTIGTCGATIVDGEEEGAKEHHYSGPHSISADGSRVFFGAVPGSGCSGPGHLYMRVNGTETVDIGPYGFVAANAEGTRLLLKTATEELVGYDTATKTFEHQSAAEQAEASELARLGIPQSVEPSATSAFSHPRYSYSGANSSGNGGPDVQVERYDSVEHLWECVSCASSFDPAPKQPAFLDTGEGQPFLNGGFSDRTVSSANGDFVFFSTPSALVPDDVDGEILIQTPEYEAPATGTSPSSDVYEWRASGVDGCGRVQGCLALITDGRGGYLNLLLGTAHGGRDVFFWSRSALSPRDPQPEGSIAEGNIYDARIGGGEPPPPPKPTECEGDACSPAPPAPNDQTPSSLTFTGNGNLLPELSTSLNTKPKSKPEPKKCRGERRSKKSRCRARAKRSTASRSYKTNRKRRS